MQCVISFKVLVYWKKNQCPSIIMAYVKGKSLQIILIVTFQIDCQCTLQNESSGLEVIVSSIINQIKSLWKIIPIKKALENKCL